jgi:putative chitinase
MMAEITRHLLLTLAPSAKVNYVESLTDPGPARAFGLRSFLRVQHFLAQVLHETGGLTILEESMNYTAARIVEVWPSRFSSPAAARNLEHNPEALANSVYGGRMGNEMSGDGWKYRGRGLLQVTGRDSYRKYGRLLGIALEELPQLAYSAEWAFRIALAEWSDKKCSEAADSDDLRGVTRAINGGLIGIGSRQSWLLKVGAAMRSAT